MPQKTKFDDGTWKHEIRRISDLHPNPDNPRTITKETLKGLKKSMEKNGYTHRIIIDSHNMILSGHARWLVFKEKDPNAEIEVLAAQRELTEDEIKNAVIGHNVDGGELVPFTEIVEEARKYIKQLGGFEKLACWGLQ